MQGKVDLHTHTNCSDGYYSPVQLVKKAKEASISVLGITDHDNIDALPEAIQQAIIENIEIISGVEISTMIDKTEIHILGYFFDPADNELNQFLKSSKEERLKRAEAIVRKLNYLGMKLSIADIQIEAQSATIGRPHIANAMLKRGYISSFNSAFTKYLGKGCAAYVQRTLVTPETAIKIIHKAGGLAILAHPGFTKDSTVENIIKSGIDGIEFLHPSHSKGQVEYYRKLAGSNGLLKSGGSDFHGGKREDEQNLGMYYISYQYLDAMRQNLLNL